MERRALLVVPLAAAAAAGCGSASTSHTSSPATSSRPSVAHVRGATTAATTPTPTTQAPAPLQAEAASAATGDIPDNQVFLVFRDAGYSVKYPEGWAQKGSGTHVVFRDKNNIVRIVVSSGRAESPASVRRELAAEPTLTITEQPRRTTVSGAPVVKVVYRTRSTANPVTGKRVDLTVDRYYLARGGKTAVVDLGTPVGVDNVDAYRLIVQSFRWR